MGLMYRKPMSKDQFSRRGLLKGLAAVGAAAATPAIATKMSAPVQPRRALRLAHLTDIHVGDLRNSAQGFAECLAHVQNHVDAPSLILNGGDSIFDAFATGAASTKRQWQIFHKVYHDSCSLPVEHCIGNHDIWGWDNRSSSATGREPHYGKHWAMDELGLRSPYRSFDVAGWHFIVLDSIQRHANSQGYIAKLGEEQMAWLDQDLSATPVSTPVLVLSHCPILSVSAYFRFHSEDDGGWRVPASWMHIDARRIKDIFARHPNVKLCLSGHEHLHGKVHYLGVAYSCNGAVSGAWWQGAFQETQPGYALVDLYEDGTFKNRYVKWGWRRTA
jgi:Icc protein